jgi:catechol 2,3-dioxygenase-like lactoylglutathione lyase family enzyme
VTEALACVTLVVREYDEAIRFFTESLGFTLLEDAPRPGGKRWVRVAPGGSPSLSLLLAQAASPEQERAIGRHAGGRVGLFLHTDDFQATYERLRQRRVVFLETPRIEAYGTVAVFEDLYGDKWDLIQPNGGEVTDPPPRMG